LIIDCLRYWVDEMHVDGFRFDLASVLSRDEWGQPLKSPQTLWTIESDPVLAGTKIIAEAWDAAGLYQVGSFVGHRWAEWNGQFRDDVRRFVKSDTNTVTRLAARITGSPDLYPQPDREPNRSINFVTCHDGFTLNDLVSYTFKHNEANSQRNADGPDTNFSWHCGVEGPTNDPAIENLRQRQIKNLLATLFLSQGTPMLLMGDEVRRTQRGNNNAYCQDNAISWFDWRDVETHGDLLRFVRQLIAFTQRHALFRREYFWTAAPQRNSPTLTWHGVHLAQPDWSDESHSLAFSLRDATSSDHFHIILNAYWEPLDFDLPPLPPDRRWHRLIDTALPAPNDFTPPDRASALHEHRYRAESRSVVVLSAQAVNS
jgi:glycogen operon protein